MIIGTFVLNFKYLNQDYFWKKRLECQKFCIFQQNMLHWGTCISRISRNLRVKLLEISAN
jgi:hypothetical protein